MRTLCALAAGLVTLALPGCGGRADEDVAGATSATPGLSSSSQTLGEGSSEQEAATIAIRYVRAVAAEDWAGACATRSKKDREEMARYAGSCERGFKVVFDGKPTALFETVETGAVRLRGTMARVNLHQPGHAGEPFMFVVAVRENGEWRLEDVPDSQAP